VLTILGGIIGGTYAFYGLLAVTSVFTAIFMVRHVKNDRFFDLSKGEYIEIGIS
jgi:hypothetical protein